MRHVLGPVALLAACAHAPTRAYPGPPRPPEEVARVVIVAPGGGLERGEETAQAYAISVDGREVAKTGDLEVLPGFHEIEVWYGWFTVPETYYQGPRSGYWKLVHEGTIRLPLDAKAGRRYELDWNITRHAGPHGFREAPNDLR